MREPAVLRRAGRAARVTFIAPFRFRSNCCRSPLSDISSNGPLTDTSAQLTRAPSRSPNEAVIRAIDSDTWVLSVMSVSRCPTVSPTPANFAAPLRAAPSPRSSPMTCQPLEANSTATASPTPLELPVTMAVCMAPRLEERPPLVVGCPGPAQSFRTVSPLVMVPG